MSCIPLTVTKDATAATCGVEIGATFGKLRSRILVNQQESLLSLQRDFPAMCFIFFQITVKTATTVMRVPQRMNGRDT